jgi:transposase-like protein
MRANRLVLAGSFCWNKDCPDYGQPDHGNIVKYGRSKKGTQRLKCITCERVFVENKGTVFYVFDVK